jgi:hypothetical protein
MELHTLFRIQRMLLYAFLFRTLLSTPISVYGAKTGSCTTHLGSALTHIKFIVKKRPQTSLLKRVLRHDFKKNRLPIALKKLYVKSAF